MTSDTATELNSLHTTLIDSRNGYEEALEDAGPRGLKALFSEMIDMHRRHAAELSPHLAALGVTPTSDGSMMSTVHRTVISVRSLFNDLDESILPGLIDGEKRVLAAYDDALAAMPADLRTLLQNQRAALARKVDDMRRMVEAAA